MMGKEQDIGIILFQDQVQSAPPAMSQNRTAITSKKRSRGKDRVYFCYVLYSVIYSEATTASQKRYFKNRRKCLLMCIYPAPFPLRMAAHRDTQRQGSPVSLG